MKYTPLNALINAKSKANGLANEKMQTYGASYPNVYFAFVVKIL